MKMKIQVNGEIVLLKVKKKSSPPFLVVPPASNR